MGKVWLLKDGCGVGVGALFGLALYCGVENG